MFLQREVFTCSSAFPALCPHSTATTSCNWHPTGSESPVLWPWAFSDPGFSVALSLLSVPSFLLGLLGQPFLLLLPCKSGSSLSGSFVGSSPASAPTWLLPGLCAQLSSAPVSVRGSPASGSSATIVAQATSLIPNPMSPHPKDFKLIWWQPWLTLPEVVYCLCGPTSCEWIFMARQQEC